MQKFLVITGPSAVGKSTVISYLLGSAYFHLSVSYTTRRPRPWEVDGVDYVFVSEDEFKAKLAEGFFLEHTVFSGNYYGTPSHIGVSDKIILFDVDVDGYHFFKERYPASYFCLLTADRETIELRLTNRMRTQLVGDPARELAVRMRSVESFKDIGSLDSFNFILSNTSSLDDSYLQADKLISEANAHYAKIDSAES
ncbi:guanylate kinase [Pancytospora philotis]|nr:guanylate kinase [Pancytospora philotis]KAI4293147.1 guanylate kinase [Pancytospora philotis]